MSIITPPAPASSQYADKFGFTPFAKQHLLAMTGDGTDGYAKDAKHRVYIMGGRDVNGKRIRREMRGTLTAVFIDYTGRWGYTRLWVQWKDGRRHLVHRKS